MGTWIEMADATQKMMAFGCRSLRGNVDRNDNQVMTLLCNRNVVPYVGTWIEITKVEQES